MFTIPSGKAVAVAMVSNDEIVKLTAFEDPPPGPGLLTVMLAVPARPISLAEIEAVSVVAPPNVVGRSDPFHRTVEPETKLDPETVRVKAGPPALAEVGLIPEIDGTGFRMAKDRELELPPPGLGLLTVTEAVPAEAISLAEIEAVSVVALLKVVGRSDPFHRTVEPATKLDPETVRVKAGPPAFAEVGLIPEIDGTGFWIVKDCALEFPPPGLGLSTVTLAVPTEAISLAGIEAVSFVALLKVVGRSDPFHWTVEPETKLDPETVSVKAGPPALVEVGLIPEIDGTGFWMVKDWALESPPPGLGLLTVTLAVPDETISLAEIEAVSDVALLKVVGRSDPFHRTVELEMKLEPETIRVKAGPPALAEVGLIPEIDGTGLLMVRVKSLSAFFLRLSVTRILNLNMPAAVGVPLNTPLATSNAIPGGNDPDRNTHVYGGVPPTAESA